MKERGKLYRKKKVKAKGYQSEQRREGSDDVMRIIFRAVQIIFPRSRDTIYIARSYYAQQGDTIVSRLLN